MSTDFINAALSYYGLGSAQHKKAEVFTNDRGQILLAIDPALTGEDMVAIVNRMQAMQQGQQAPTTGASMLSHETMRKAYDDMTPAERAPFGSFAMYRAWVAEQMGVGEPTVPELPAVRGMPTAMWVAGHALSDMQKRSASGYRAEEDTFLVSLDLLTPDQRTNFTAKEQS